MWTDDTDQPKKEFYESNYKSISTTDMLNHQYLLDSFVYLLSDPYEHLKYSYLLYACPLCISHPDHFKDSKIFVKVS